MEDTVAAVAESIVDYVRREDLDGLVRNLSISDNEWRQELRYEFNLEKMMEAIFRNDILIPKLVMCDILTISPFHYTALRGVDSILEMFVLRHQIPVDMCVQSGSTALHFACFSGMLDTVMLLVDKFHADVNRRDRYGWTALHYASTEGNLSVIEYLVRRGADISARDKDGTTAAFRAQAFGHVNIVSYFVQSSGDEDLLLVEDSMVSEEDGDIYATVDVSKKTASNGGGASQSLYEIPVTTSSGNLVDKSTTRDKDDVANLVRNQLNDVLEGTPDPYMNPISRGTETGNRVPLDIGMNTLTRILKDEFMKFKADHEINKVAGSNSDSAPQNQNRLFSMSSDYEDISKFSKGTTRSHDFSPTQLATSVDEDDIEAPAEAPPLPPRTNSVAEEYKRDMITKASRKKSNGKNAKSKKKNVDRVHYATLTLDDVAKRHPGRTKALLILNRFDHSGTVMEACFQALVQNIGDADNWKRLSTALPLRNRPDAVKRCVRNIEMRNPADPQKQTIDALHDWRCYFGEAANVDALIAAMRQSGLDDKVPLVEAAAMEFSA